MENATNTEVAQAAPPQYAGQLGGARPQSQSFAAATAAATGQSKATTNRALARADALGDTTLDKITGTSLDTGGHGYILGTSTQQDRLFPFVLSLTPNLPPNRCARARGLDMILFRRILLNRGDPARAWPGLESVCGAGGEGLHHAINEGKGLEGFVCYGYP